MQHLLSPCEIREERGLAERVSGTGRPLPCSRVPAVPGFSPTRRRQRSRSSRPEQLSPPVTPASHTQRAVYQSNQSRQSRWRDRREQQRKKEEKEGERGAEERVRVRASRVSVGVYVRRGRESVCRRRASFPCFSSGGPPIGEAVFRKSEVEEEKQGKRSLRTKEWRRQDVGVSKDGFEPPPHAPPMPFRLSSAFHLSRRSHL